MWDGPASASRQKRAVALTVAVVGAGLCVMGIVVALIQSYVGAPLSWLSIALYAALTLVTMAIAATVVWTFLADPDPESQPAVDASARTEAPTEPAHIAASLADARETSFANQQRLLDDVRHELKTPITIIRGHLEIMDPHDPDDVAMIRDLGILELDRMTGLIGDIDLLASVEADGFARDEIDLSALTTRVGEMVSVIPGHDWTIEAAAQGIVFGDRDRLLQAWVQLADNAAKYTPEGTSIEIGSSFHPSVAQLWVRDHGPGIAPALRHRIFRRFDRGAGTRSVRGSGLGLAIVDAIAKGHGGRCTVADTPGGGATFTIDIPVGTRAALPGPIRAGDVLIQREAIE